jgi:hypothetical protein
VRVVAGEPRTRARRIAPALVGVALTIAVGSAAAASSGGRDAADSAPPAQPPTTAEVREATERFLNTVDAPSPASVRRSAGTARLGPVPISIFPTNRVVSFYGAPQLPATIVGRKTPSAAGSKLLTQAAAYEGTKRRPVIPAFDLIAVIATSTRGADRKYRFRQDDLVIATYLEQARAIGARLMLDIQPGRANVAAEARALAPWLVQPDVDLSIDPEWNVGRRGVPGRTQGSIKARKLNRVSDQLQELIDANALPPKLLVVHQFRKRSVRKRRRIAQRPDVGVTLNFDGIGKPPAKKAGYAQLSSPKLFDGFSLFYRLDRKLMQPPAVLRLEPEPDFVLYQ